MKSVKRLFFMGVFITFNVLSLKAQISSTHYLPPLKTAVAINILGQRIYLSTPETTPFDVNVYQGTSTTPISTISISNSQPGMFVPPGGNGTNNSSIVSEANAGIVVSIAGLRFDAPSGKGFYVNWRAAEANQGASLVSLGKAALGMNFKWGGLPQLSSISGNSVIGIMATEDNTVVKIGGYNTSCTFSKTIGGTFNTSGITDDSLTINLNAGQTYTLECITNTTANLSGWIGANISSNKNIAVNQGHLILLATGGGGDYSMTQLAPITNIGKEYLLIRGNGNNKDEYPLIIATKDNTSIYLNNEVTPYTTLNNGQWVQIPSGKYSQSSTPPAYTDGFFAGANMYIRSTENIYVFQAICGNSSGATIDLFQVAPLSCFLDYGVNNIPDILKTANGNVLLNSIGLTLTASSAITTDNITIQYDSASIRKTVSTSRLNDARRTVLGTTDWVSYYIPNITPSSAGNLSIQTNGPVAIGYLGVSGVMGVGGYFSGFGSIPTISTAAQNLCLNASPTALTSSVLNATYTYQWYENNTQVNTGGTIITGATASTYTPSTATAGTKYYYVAVTNQVGCTVNSNASGSVKVNQNTIALSSNENTNAQTLCKNNPIANITYATTGATNTTVSGLPTGVNGAWLNNVLTISGTPTITGNYSYTVSTIGGCSTVTASGTITVTDAGVSITSSAGTSNICPGAQVTFTATVCNGSATPTYQWFKNGNAIIGANSSSYSTTALNDGDQVYLQFLTVNSNTITTNIIGSTTISLTSAAGTNSQTVCLNDLIIPITYTATGATSATVTGLPTGLNGVWANNLFTISGTPTVSGNFTYTINFSAAGCGSTNISGTINILAGSTPVYSVTLNGEPCVGQAVLSATTGFNSYTWQKNNATITGATSNAYTPTSVGVYKVIVSNGVCASTSSATTIYDCGLTAEGKMKATTSTALVSVDGSTNNGTGLQEVGKILSISNTYSVNIIESPVNGGRLLLNLDAKNYNSLAHTVNPTTWKDLSINHNDAPIFGTPVYSTNNGGGFNFPGGNANYVQANNTTYFNNNSFAIQAWVYPTNLNDWNPIIDFGNGENSNNIILSNTYGTSGKPGLNIEGSLLQANATISLNAWHFICASFDVSNNTATIYIDGQPSGSATLNVPTNIVRTKCYIGKSNMISTPKPNFIGGIGAIQIYQGYLNAAEILSNYNATKNLFGL